MESLQPLDNGIHHAKLIEVHPSNMSWNVLLAKIFNSQISAGMYQHGQRVVATLMRRELTWAAKYGLLDFVKRSIDNDSFSAVMMVIRPSNVGTPTLTPSSRTPSNSPRRDGPVGIGTSFGYLRTITISTDWVSGEVIDWFNLIVQSARHHMIRP